MSTEIQRAYARGYQAGIKERESGKRADVLVMEGLIERAQRAESHQGFGTCDQCLFWSRETPKTHWGPCSVRDKVTGNRPHPWPWFAFDSDKLKPTEPVPFTSEKFGCILFKKKQP